MSFSNLGREIGELVDRKQYEYGDSISKSEKILEVLYPDGVKPCQYSDLLLVTRTVDKLCRISMRGPSRKDLGGESPWTDIAGYGMLGVSKDKV